MAESIEKSLEPALAAAVARLMPGAELISVRPFCVDEGEEDLGTHKGIGYGSPLRLTVRRADGRQETLVFHTAKADQFGHDRRADRAAEMLLGFDRFGGIPAHVAALDVGAVSKDGERLISLAEAGEFYLLTSYAEGHLYADELREIARRGSLTPRDGEHAEALARYLVALHSERIDDPRRYQRAIRDLVGSGEGVFGLVDAYADDVPAASPERIAAIETRCVEHRRRLKKQSERLRRTHGDFHPFNVVFQNGEPAVLDASRGCMGDAADDVTCMAINYVFFAVEHPDTWRGVFSELWHRFWRVYLQASGDRELLRVCAPFLAWRGLVVANPLWYPQVSEGARDRVLRLIEKTLDAEAFDPAFADEVLA